MWQKKNSMNKNRGIWALALIVSTTYFISQAAFSAVNQPSKEHKNSDIQVEQKNEDAIRDVLIAVEVAASESDPGKLSALWSEDACFIDETGTETRGWKAIHQRFENAFKQRASQYALGMHPEKISFPADNIAIVVGTASRKNGDSDLPVTRFTMVLVKNKSAWYINQSTETKIESANSGQHLRDLDWLIGEWKVDKAEGTVKFNVDWAPGRNFILSKCTIENANSAAQVDSQVIGWDPRSNSIVSWHFDNNGGFAYGKWSNQAKQWTVQVAGVGSDGTDIRATNLFTLKDANEFSWRSVDRSNDGKMVPDTEALTVQKVRH